MAVMGVSRPYAIKNLFLDLYARLLSALRSTINLASDGEWVSGRFYDD